LLPPETQRLWDFLKARPILSGFILIGGSALALRLQHRLSEDLDFIFPGPTLPKEKLSALKLLATRHGFDFQRLDDEAALAEFQNAGEELHDHQQDYVVNGKVRVSFFVPQNGMGKVLQPALSTGVRLAELPELFKTKCLVSALRSKTRDWLDLYLLFRDHGFTADDYRHAFAEAGMAASCDVGLARLCSGIPQRSDEGYLHLLESAPSLEVMQAFFSQIRDQIEAAQAAEAFRREREQ
jgi:hypothetical protein